MKEIFTYGSVGGVGRKPGPYPASNRRLRFGYVPWSLSGFLSQVSAVGELGRSAMTVMRVFSVILVIIATIGCESSKRQAYKSNDYAGSGHLRIRNGSDEDFFDVVFQGNRFGDIKKGQVTEYQLAAQWSTYLEGITVLPGDYPRDEISLRRAGSKDRTRYVWVDYPGRFVSGPYRFTFVLTLQNDYGRESQHLDIEVAKDD